MICVNTIDRAIAQDCIHRRSPEASQMDTTNTAAIARYLFATQGAKAIAEAAQKAEHFDHAGNKEQARMWQKVEAVLREMRGPRQS
jgi:hypothetical protein